MKSIGAFVMSGNQAFFFAGLKPRAERNVSVDQIIDRMRPMMFSVPGILAFMQNPPPITVSGTFGTSAYQLTVQSANLKEIYAWAPLLMAKMRALPDFHGHQLRYADREPATVRGYRPRPGPDGGRDAGSNTERAV